MFKFFLRIWKYCFPPRQTEQYYGDTYSSEGEVEDRSFSQETNHQDPPIDYGTINSAMQRDSGYTSFNFGDRSTIGLEIEDF